MPDTETSSALNEHAPPPDVVSRLPKGWVPEGAGVWVVGRWEPEAKHWEALVPQFSVAGMGKTSADAITNAIELLDDYLALCAAEGKSYEECFRPINRLWRFRVVREALSAVLASRRRRQRPPEHSYLRLPIAAQ